MTALNRELTLAVDSLGGVLLHCPMHACFRTINVDYRHFNRGFVAPLSKTRDNFCSRTTDLRNRIDRESPSGQLGYWFDQLSPSGMFSAFKKPEAGFGVILSPPEEDCYGRRLHFMADFFMEEKQRGEVLAVIKQSPEALFHFLASTLTEGETPPLFRGIKLSEGQQEHVSQFTELYVHSMTGGTPPKSCCLPYNLINEKPSGQLVSLG